MKNSYKESGVDIDAGIEVVDRIKQHVQKTYRKEVKAGIGGFGSLFALQNKYKNPILVSGTDGVGTKLKIAFEAEVNDTVGIDLVAMCVNDILVQGAEPLFFLDYVATGKLKPEQVEDIVKGIATGCLEANCSLIGGETAEMPSMYSDGEYDLAGFAVGVVDEDKIVDGSKIEEGDVIIGLSSNGIHSNGYSLVRHLLFNKSNHSLTDYIEELGDELGNVLLKPTRIYVKPVLEILEKYEVKGMAHITGGGLIDNIPRVLPEGLQAEIRLGSWEVPAIFNYMEKIGSLEQTELYRTFNMGIGFILIVKEDDQKEVLELANQLGEKAQIIGMIKKGSMGVSLLGDEY